MPSGDAARQVDRDRHDVKGRRMARQRRLRELKNSTVGDSLMSGAELVEEQRRLRSEMYERTGRAA